MDQKLEKTIRRQVFFWLVTLGLFLFMLWLFADILLPFVAGMALAYFLDPVADLLERWGLSRLMATVIILFFFVVIFVISLMILVPILGNQIAGFLERMPDLVTRLQSMVASSESPWLKKIIGIEGQSLQDNLNGLVKQDAGWIATLLQH